MKKKIEPDLCLAGFAIFWSVYPRKVSRIAAKKAWAALAKADELPAIDVLVAAVCSQSATPEWREHNGRYIPYPAKWLRDRRWEDEGVRIPAPADARPQLAAETSPESEEVSPELAELQMRAQAMQRVEEALDNDLSPDPGDVLAMSPVALTHMCRRYALDPYELRARAEEEVSHER